jgi:hypothetical protein
MVMARGGRFADDVVYMARDCLRLHDGLESENEKTREMSKFSVRREFQVVLSLVGKLPYPFLRFAYAILMWLLIFTDPISSLAASTLRQKWETYSTQEQEAWFLS